MGPPGKIEQAESGGSSRVCARARAPFDQYMEVQRNVGRSDQKAKFSRKIKKNFGHLEKGRGEKRARRTSGRRPDVRREIYF